MARPGARSPSAGREMRRRGAWTPARPSVEAGVSHRHRRWVRAAMVGADRRHEGHDDGGGDGDQTVTGWLDGEVRRSGRQSPAWPGCCTGASRPSGDVAARCAEPRRIRDAQAVRAASGHGRRAEGRRTAAIRTNANADGGIIADAGHEAVATP